MNSTSRLVYRGIAALSALTIGTCLAGVYVSGQGSTRIRGTADTLFVADARIPLTALGQPEALHGDGARAWRTHMAVLRAFMVMHNFIPGAMRVEALDLGDPTIYLHLATRTPELSPRHSARGRERAGRASCDDHTYGARSSGMTGDRAT